jgi:hypothetical protein
MLSPSVPAHLAASREGLSAMKLVLTTPYSINYTRLKMQPEFLDWGGEDQLTGIPLYDSIAETAN